MQVHPDDFDTFYLETRQRLLGLVYVVTGDVAEAQDAVQEAFIRAWLRWGSLRTYDNPEAWVRMVACRVATSRWRSMRRRLRAQDRAALVAVFPMELPSTDAIDLIAAMRRLPEEQRIAIALYHLVGMPVAEVARETGAPEGTVKARLARGRKALANLLGTDATENLGGSRA